MSVGATPSLNFIGDTVGDTAPHSMSEMRGIRFATGNSPTSGAISLSDFRNQVLTRTVTQQAKVQASDKQSSDRYGWACAVSSDGTYAIFSAPWEATGGSTAGAAYIVTRSGSTWSQQAKLLASDRQAGDFFGWGVGMSDDGTYAIVGAQYEDTGAGNAGAAYIYVRSDTSWSQQAKIQHSDRVANDYFGAACDISGNGSYAVVGAYKGDSTATNSGTAYTFVRSGTSWSQQAKITASDRRSSDEYGRACSISTDGSYCIIGARYKNRAYGAAFIYSRSNTSWSQQAWLTASDQQGGDEFGWAVSMSGNGTYVVATTYKEDTGGTDAGAAYTFVRSGSSWSQQAKVQASDKQAQDNFGHGVGINNDGTYFVCGALKEDTGAGDAGAAYTFERSGTTWSQKSKIQASDRQAQDNFGISCAISGDGTYVGVGAYGEDTGGAGAGAGYMFVNSYYI